MAPAWPLAGTGKDGTYGRLLRCALRPWPCCGLDFLVTFCVKTKSKANSAAPGSLLKTATTPLAQGVGADPLAAAFFTQQNTQSQANRPKAYLTVLFFDEQFKLDNNASRTQQVGTGTMNPNNPGQIGFMAGSAVLAQKSGYCYIYISNESDDLVYFDNFTLSHEKSSLMEETHYYPFGLTMAGISSKAAGKLENKNEKFQGQPMDDELGLNWYGFKWRNHDPQIGRFIQLDPLSEEYVHNSTYAFSENKVIAHIELEGLEAIPISRDLWQQAQTLPPHAKVVVGIGIGLFALGELIFNNPEALSGGGRSQSYPATFDLYIKSGETKPTTVNSTPTEQPNNSTPKPPANSRAGKPFTPKEKEKVIEANRAKNNGNTVCENCGTNTTKPEQSKRGVTPPKTDTQVDHVKPKSKGGSGTADNGQVLCRDCNSKKSDKEVVPVNEN